MLGSGLRELGFGRAPAAPAPPPGVALSLVETPTFEVPARSGGSGRGIKRRLPEQPPANSGRHRPNLAPILGRCWPNLGTTGRRSPHPGPNSNKFGQYRAETANVGSMSIIVRPKSPESDQFRPRLQRKQPKLTRAQRRPTSTPELEQHRPRLAQIWLGIDQIPHEGRASRERWPPRRTQSCPGRSTRQGHRRRPSPRTTSAYRRMPPSSSAWRPQLQRSAPTPPRRETTRNWCVRGVGLKRGSPQTFDSGDRPWLGPRNLIRRNFARKRGLKARS